MARVRKCGPGKQAVTTSKRCPPVEPSCDENGHDYQVLEPDSPLRKCANLDLGALRRQVPNGPTRLYSYVVESVRRSEGALRHHGSGPNIEGGLLTLCTCKYRLRTYPGVAVGTWIAGFSGSRQARNSRPAQRNTLFFLTRVQYTFESQMALWRSPLIPETTKRRKSSRRSRLGDFFEPRRNAEDPFDIRAYHPPMQGHSHDGHRWHEDIEYPTKVGRRPAILVGDPQYTFVWTDALVECSQKLGRAARKYSTMQDFLAVLASGS